MNLRLESATERFRTIVAAQPAATKRQKATDEEVAGLVNDLGTGVPELTADEINAVRQDAVQDYCCGASLPATVSLKYYAPSQISDIVAPRWATATLTSSRGRSQAQGEASAVGAVSPKLLCGRPALELRLHGSRLAT